MARSLLGRVHEMSFSKQRKICFSEDISMYHYGGKEHWMVAEFKNSHFTITAAKGSASHQSVLGCESWSSNTHQEYNRQQFWNGLQEPSICLTMAFCKWAMYQQENECHKKKECSFCILWTSPKFQTHSEWSLTKQLLISDLLWKKK